MNEVKDNAPFLLNQKPQELIKLFEGLIDRKIKEIGTLTPTPPVNAAGESPFLSTKEVQKIFSVSRQTITDWRKSGLLSFIKIKSRSGIFPGPGIGATTEVLNQLMEKND